MGGDARKTPCALQGAGGGWKQHLAYKLPCLQFVISEHPSWKSGFQIFSFYYPLSMTLLCLKSNADKVHKVHAVGLSVG